MKKRRRCQVRRRINWQEELVCMLFEEAINIVRSHLPKQSWKNFVQASKRMETWMLVLFTIGVIIAEKAVRIAWKKLKKWNLKRQIPMRTVEAEFRTEDLGETMVRVKDWNFVQGCRSLCVCCG